MQLQVLPIRLRALLGALLLLVIVLASSAQAERAQRGNLIVSLDGRLSPLRLPREGTAPVSIHLAGGLRTDDGSTLPRVRRVEIGLPGSGVLDTAGLPLCRPRLLHDTRPGEARAACGDARVGHGMLSARVTLPRQPAFTVHAKLQAFNARIGGRRAVVVHGFSADPPTTLVLPFSIEHRAGRFGTVLVGDLSSSLGPWPRLADFELTLSRRFSHRGRVHSYLRASCPIPRRFTAGFFSFAKLSFELVGGGHIGTGIARSCRAL